MRIPARVYLAHTSKAGRLMQGIRIDSKPLDDTASRIYVKDLLQTCDTYRIFAGQLVY